MLTSPFRKLAAWVEDRELARSVKRKEQQLPPFPSNPDTGEAIVTPEFRQTYESACIAVFTPEERNYRQRQAEAEWFKREVKAERDKADVVGPFATALVLVPVAFFAYIGTHGMLATAALTVLGWAIFREYEKYRLWRYRINRRLQHVVLRDVRKVFVEKMPFDLEEALSAEITNQLHGRLVVVPDRADADATFRSSDQQMVRRAIASGRYWGPEWGASWGVSLVDKDGARTLWSGWVGQTAQTGDLGKRTTAEHLVQELSDTLA